MVRSTGAARGYLESKGHLQDEYLPMPQPLRSVIQGFPDFGVEKPDFWAKASGKTEQNHGGCMLTP
jgi:hypothetical protein